MELNLKINNSINVDTKPNSILLDKSDSLNNTIENKTDKPIFEILDTYTSKNQKFDFESTTYKPQLNKNTNINKNDIEPNSFKTNGKLSDEEQNQVNKLKAIDSKVKAHEAAHLAAAGGLAKGGATFTYQQGPDGKQYAIGGEVQIELSSNSDNPDETITKMQIAQRAALAPADPSSQDRSVAASASKIETQARAEKYKAIEEQNKSNQKEVNNDITSRDFEIIKTNNVGKESKLENRNLDKKEFQNELFLKVISKYTKGSGNIALGKNIYSYA